MKTFFKEFSWLSIYLLNTVEIKKILTRTFTFMFDLNVRQICMKIGINVHDYMSNTMYYYKLAGKNPAIFDTRLNSDAWIFFLKDVWTLKARCSLSQLHLETNKKNNYIWNSFLNFFVGNLKSIKNTHRYFNISNTNKNTLRMS
jgi:hypothetical protein